MKFIMAPEEPQRDQVEAAYMLIESMPTGSEARHKRIVEAVYRTMIEARPPVRVGGLGSLQKQVLQIVFDFVQENGKSPTYQEIGDQLNISRGSAHHTVAALARKGILAQDKAQRGIRILQTPAEALTKR